MERNVFEERLFHAASVTKVAWKARRMHPYSELNKHCISLIQKVHSSVRRAPVLNMINTLGSRIHRRQRKIRWSDVCRKRFPNHTPMLTRLGNSAGRKGLTLMLI